MIEIATVGGYDEVGKNMTAVKVDDDVIILDMGLHLEKYIQRTQDEDSDNVSANELVKIGALPNINVIDDWKKKVKAIIPTHAHLDHVGAIPYLANKYKAPILATPFTAEVIKAICRDNNKKLPNKIKILNSNSTYKISKDLRIEFINVTHSTPQVVMVAIHTKYGVVLYANDFKFDNFPVLGTKPNYKRLRELGKKGIAVLISDGTRCRNPGKTPSESVAREMLKDVMVSIEHSNQAIFITTFSSHIARLKSIIEFGRQLNRKIIFLGRSLNKYVTAAENINLVSFSKKAEMVDFRKRVAKKLRDVSKNPSKYLVVVTGHQGEPGAILSRIVDHDLPFAFKPKDIVIFSCTVIPVPANIAQREVLESKLKREKVRIFKDIHVSGHAAREDLRDLIEMTQPKHIIPAHGDFTLLSPFADLAIEMDYVLGSTLHVMRDEARLIIK